MNSLRIGTSGWNYKHWRGTVYPKGVRARRWLEHYATLFDTVEVNATFYRLQRPEVPRAWAEQTPDAFRSRSRAAVTAPLHERDAALGRERRTVRALRWEQATEYH